MNLEYEATLTDGQALLLRLIYEVSEEFWCAGWHAGIHNLAWAVAVGDSDRMGLYKVRDDPRFKRMRRLAEAEGVWFRWDDDAEGPRPITLARWREEYGNKRSGVMEPGP